MTTTRRERIRNNTRDEIKAIARQQMVEGGTAAISLNGIARAMELTSPALYRYYASRDELITALIIDTYNALADALEEASAAHPANAYAQKLFDTSLAYRAWALTHPTDFLLIYGNPIPGYQLPSEQAMAAAQRVYAAFLGTMQAAYIAGFPPKRATHRTLAIELCPPLSEHPEFQIDPVVMIAGIAGWTKLHGMVMLELLGHLQGAFSDYADFYRLECRHIMEDLGLSLDMPPLP
jgi:AcrR family transcriptional regulator